MKKLQKGGSFMIRGLAMIAGLLACTSVIYAHPYASGITNNSGTIYFVLNESNSAVTVTLTNIGTGNSAILTGAAGVSSLPSTVGTNVGTQFFSMTQGATTYTNYSIKVAKAGNGVIFQTSSDANTNNMYFGPRGVAVNQNPTNKYFGRIYISEASAGSTVVTGVAGTGRTTVGRGWHVLNGDQSDVLGYGLTSQAVGITLSAATSGTTYSPFKCYVGADDFLYAADAMTNTCTVWQIGPDLTGTATNALNLIGLATPPANITNSGTAQGNHGRTTGKPFVTGTLAAGNLVMYTVDADYGSRNSIQQYNIGSGPLPYTGLPVEVANTGGSGTLLFNDIAVVGTNIYTSGRRTSAGDSYGAIKVFDSLGNLLWDSYTANFLRTGSTTDPFLETQGMAVSADGTYLGTERTDTTICTVKITNGIPDLSTLVTNVSAIAGTTGRGAAWDAADNFYIASGGVDRLRVFSMGLSTTCITGGDTTGAGANNHGTFQLIIPATSVSVTPSVPLASQNHGTPIAGVFTITRAGPDLSQPLTVPFTLGGTATNVADYALPAGVTTTVTFAPNQDTTNVTITPVVDAIPRLTNTVILTLQTSINYQLGAPGAATLFIQNTGPQLLRITAAQSTSMYKPFPNDYGSFTITRLGDVGVADYTVTNFSLAGTAVLGTDFVAPTVTIHMSNATETAAVFPLVATTSYTGNKTVTVGINSDATVGPGYTGSTNITTLTIIDNAYPPATVLYSNSLSAASDSTNWSIKFASTNDPLNLNPPDYDVEFGFPLATDAIGTPPNGLSTALKITVNKNGVGKASSGVNVYLKSNVFSGDYAVRFNMNLVQGTNTAASTEGALFGMDHTGTATNWWAGDILTNVAAFRGPWSADGIWWWVDSDPGGAGAGDFIEYTGTNNVLPNAGWTRLAAVLRTAVPFAFKNVAVAPAVLPPFTTVGLIGMPANHSGSNTSTWSDVEMKQIKNVVTMAIDKTVITTYTNTTIWTNGQIMLGYNDPFASIGTNGAVYFSNLRVVQLGPPSITSIGLSGTNVVIGFTSIDGDDTAASFVVQSSANVVGTYVDVSPAAAVTQSGQTYSTTTGQSGSTRFYRIRHK